MAEDILAKYQSKLKDLSTKKMEVEYQLNAKKKEAEELKAKLKELGYNSLNEAKEAYQRQYSILIEKEKQLSSILDQVDKMDSNVSSKGDILKFIQEKETFKEKVEAKSKEDVATVDSKRAQVVEEKSNKESVSANQDDMFGMDSLSDLL